jgi:F0F1-type ATP synthase assembly protein I
MRLEWRYPKRKQVQNSPQKMAGSKHRNIGDLLSVGIMFPACVGIGYGIGYLIDQWVGTKSTFKIVFLLFGMVAAFVNVFKVAKRLSEDEKNSSGPGNP